MVVGVRPLRLVLSSSLTQRPTSCPGSTSSRGSRSACSRACTHQKITCPLPWRWTHRSSARVPPRKCRLRDREKIFKRSRARVCRATQRTPWPHEPEKTRASYAWGRETVNNNAETSSDALVYQRPFKSQRHRRNVLGCAEKTSANTSSRARLVSPHEKNQW